MRLPSPPRVLDATRWLLAAAFAFGASAALALPVVGDEPAWQEIEAAPPPAFNLQQLISVDMGPRVGLAYGIDPSTVRIGSDGVVRYVIVASSQGGAMTGLYEGIRCETGQVKTYGRYNDGQWNMVSAPDWRSLFNNGANRHSLALARQGACSNTSPPRDVAEMVRFLKNPRADMPQR